MYGGVGDSFVGSFWIFGFLDFLMEEIFGLWDFWIFGLFDGRDFLMEGILLVDSELVWICVEINFNFA